MAYKFPPELRSLVDQNMAMGNYASENQLLKAALQALIDCHASLADIRLGVADYEQGKAESLSDAKKTYQLNDLLKDCKASQRHDEADFGVDVGREVID